MSDVSTVNGEASVGADMYDFIADLYPICRSITGPGIRQTLQAVRERVPLKIRSVPTGTPVFDWTVPKEWTIRDAYVKNPAGERVVDFREHSLHVVNYSVPVHRTMSRKELEPHLHTLPEQPDLIPYRTSYYNEAWGFCLSETQRQRLGDGPFEVCVDSELEDGELNYGEVVIPGTSDEEVLFSTHACHPSLCNDNLSGVALCTWLAESLLEQMERGEPLRYTYRFLFIPGTIGSITWLAENENVASRIRAGLVVACVGDDGAFTYKKSRPGRSAIDRVVEYVLRRREETGGESFSIRPFTPYGYDERQYGSPGFNLPVGSLTRTPHGEYPEYHTSADNLDLVTPEALAESLDVYLEIVDVLEKNRVLTNLNPKCEPQLGKRGLYRTMGGHADAADRQMAMLWLLNLGDGHHTLLDIADRSDLSFALIAEVAATLEKSGLLAALDSSLAAEAQQSAGGSARTSSAHDDRREW